MASQAVVVYSPKNLVVLERLLRRRLWARLLALAAGLPFAAEVLATYFCALDKRTPAGVKLSLLAALAGFFLPQRLIPKALRVLVTGGDVGLLLGALQGFAAHIRIEHRQRARQVLSRLRR